MSEGNRQRYGHTQSNCPTCRTACVYLTNTSVYTSAAASYGNEDLLAPDLALLSSASVSDTPYSYAVHTTPRGGSLNVNAHNFHNSTSSERTEAIPDYLQEHYGGSKEEKIPFSTPENEKFYSRKPYLNLDPRRRQIRLLKIRPERYNWQDVAHLFPATAELQNHHGNVLNQESFLWCDIRDQALLSTAAGKYSALSYRAGDSTDTAWILINGIPFRAFANLEHSLECLRRNWNEEDANRAFWLWTDQVCIDQSNNNEKSHQVAFMKEIYQHAEQVYVCLSTASPSDPVTLSCFEGITSLRTILSEVSEIANRVPDGPKMESDLLLLFKEAGVKSFKMEQHSPFLAMLSFLRDIIHSEWWTRAWVFQEFVAPSRVYFIFKYGCLTWPEMRPFLMLLKDYPLVDALRNMAAGRIQNIIDALEMVLEKRETYLAKEKVEYRAMEARYEEMSYEMRQNRVHRDQLSSALTERENDAKRVSIFRRHRREDINQELARLREQIHESEMMHIVLEHELEPHRSSLVQKYQGIAKAAEVVKGLRETRDKQWTFDSFVITCQQDELVRATMPELEHWRGVQEVLINYREFLHNAANSRKRVSHFIKTKAEWRGKMKLISLLQFSDNFCSTDPRDRVYAFLGLADPKYNITTNYREEYTPHMLMADVAREIVLMDNRLDILDLVTVMVGGEHSFCLPSWVPDFLNGTNSRAKATRTSLHGDDLLSKFKAGAYEAHAEFTVEENDHSRMMLIAHGVPVGRIEALPSENDYNEWRLYHTDEGDLVITAATAQLGDEIWVLHGANSVYILRSGSDRYYFVGEASLWTENSEDAEFNYNHITSKLHPSKIMFGSAWSAKDPQANASKICII